MFIVDAHLDLAYNELNNGRNLRQPLSEIRIREQGMRLRGIPTVALPELQKAGVGLVFGTLFVAPAGSPMVSPHSRLVYHDSAEAHRLAMAQLDYYHRLADEIEWVRLVSDQATLEEVVTSHQPSEGQQPLEDDNDQKGEQAEPFGSSLPLGIVPLMEGADPIREPEELEMWYERGLRLIGPAWDDTRYSGGAWRGSGGLTRAGYHLLDVMADFGFILDITHMSEKASHEALDRYEGMVVATHSNARALVPGERQLSDTQIRRLGERDGVIGVVLYNTFLRANHVMGDPKELVTLDHVVAHIDHICQVLGDAAHVGIGSDLDGGFGSADIPAEMDSVADLPLIATQLRARGYAEPDVLGIMGGNWLNLLRRAFT